MTKYSIGNVVIGGNTLKNAPSNNGGTIDQVLQAGQGLATVFHGTIELMAKTIENHERENFNKKMGNNFAGTSKILNKIGVVGAP